MKTQKKKKWIIILSIILFVFIVVVPMIISVLIYHSNFDKRYEKISWMARHLDEFDGLQSQRYTFDSNNAQQLVGYKYYRENSIPKGIVVLAHGLGGGGQNPYMDVADYFAANGYIVFAYDATGNDESEGDSVKGLPQGVIDLDYAIRFVKESEEFGGLPIMLFGHSWGAYSVGSVLNLHPDVKAVVMVAGFNQSLDVIREEGQRIIGSGIAILMPYASILERFKFGNYASYNCVEGFETSAAKVMMIHSADDNMISFKNQFQMFYDKYQNNPRFTFISYEDRGHNYVYYSDKARQYQTQLNNQFAQYIETLNTELTAEIKTAYMNENLDKALLFDLDKKLMDQIVSLYNTCIK